MNRFLLALASMGLVAIGLAGNPTEARWNRPMAEAPLPPALTVVATPTQFAQQIPFAAQAGPPNAASLHPLLEVAGLFSLAIFAVLRAVRASPRW